MEKVKEFEEKEASELEKVKEFEEKEASELEKEKVEEKEASELEKEKVEEIKKKLKSGEIRIGEITAIISQINEMIERKRQKMREIDQQIQEEKLIIEKLERDKLKLKNEVRDLHVMISEIQDMIKAAVLGFVTSEISGKPVNVDPGRGYPGRGKGFRVYVKTTDAGIKSGLQSVDAEFSSMAKAVYALKPSLIGKRTDFKRKLEVWAKDGLIELQFL